MEEFTEEGLKQVFSNLSDLRLMCGRNKFNKLLEALEYVGINKLDRYKNVLNRLLKSSSHVLREVVVKNLGFISRLHCEEFKYKVFEIWEQDDNATVKKTALSAWIQYYQHTKNAKVLEELAKILADKKYNIYIRHVALGGIFLVAGETAKLFELSNQVSVSLSSMSVAKFELAIDWEQIKKLVTIPESMLKLGKS